MSSSFQKKYRLQKARARKGPRARFSSTYVFLHNKTYHIISKSQAQYKIFYIQKKVASQSATPEPEILPESQPDEECVDDGVDHSRHPPPAVRGIIWPNWPEGRTKAQDQRNRV